MIKIEITKTEEIEVTEREYEKVADSGNKEDGGAVYDYVPYKTTKKVSTTILQQEIEDDQVDIKAVIKAINKL